MISILLESCVAERLYRRVKITRFGEVPGGGEGTESCWVGCPQCGCAGKCHIEHAGVAEKRYNSVPFPNFGGDQIPNIRESFIFIKNLFINVIVKGPFFAKGNRGIENQFFMSCRSLEAGLVL